jgi:hypothetical protein
VGSKTIYKAQIVGGLLALATFTFVSVLRPVANSVGNGRLLIVFLLIVTVSLALLWTAGRIEIFEEKERQKAKERERQIAEERMLDIVEETLNSSQSAPEVVEKLRHQMSIYEQMRQVS